MLVQHVTPVRGMQCLQTNQAPRKPLCTELLLPGHMHMHEISASKQPRGAAVHSVPGAPSLDRGGVGDVQAVYPQLRVLLAQAL